MDTIVNQSVALASHLTPEQAAAEVRAAINHRGAAATERRVQFGDERPRKEKPKRTGHECVMSALKDQRKEVEVELNDGSAVRGFIVAFDKYTISMDLLGRYEGKRRVFFKHAIMSFGSVEQHNV